MRPYVHDPVLPQLLASIGAPLPVEATRNLERCVTFLTISPIILRLGNAIWVESGTYFGHTEIQCEQQPFVTTGVLQRKIPPGVI